MSLRRRVGSRLATRFGFEDLEHRGMLSANSLHCVAPVGTVPGTAGAQIGAALPGTGQGVELKSSRSNEMETHLGARLTDTQGTSTAKAKVEFETETERGVTKSKFSVKVENAAPNTVLDVRIDTVVNGQVTGSVVIGQITTDAKGRGCLTFSSNPKGSQQPFPANFPTLTDGGSVVYVGTLSGTLTTRGGRS